MMFQAYDPRLGKRLALLSPDGCLAESTSRLPHPSDAEVLEAYRVMVLARQADEWAVNLNRQGRMPTYVLNQGQEANSAGALLALRPDDWFVPAYRELAGMLMRGLPLHQIYLYWHGNELGSHLPRETYHMLPVSVPVGSQPLHAVGLAYAERFRGTDRVVIAFMGEGATSEGDWHEALNLAGVWKAAVIFFTQNNQWAISLPAKKQTASPTVAEKAFAYGFEGVQVDGNDLFAVYAAVRQAADKARAGGGPTLVEGYTYRIGPHTTSDDPRRYRSEAEVERWRALDPLLRLERYLQTRGLLGAEEVREIREKCLARAQAEFEQAERLKEPTLEDTYQFMFRELPPPLKRQLARRRA
jgi:pyruvate dehydrogenase E1 component alpha subunit